MMNVDFSLIRQSIQEGKTYSVKDGTLQKENFFEKVARHMIPFYGQNRDAETAAYLHTKLIKAIDEKDESAGELKEITECFFKTVLNGRYWYHTTPLAEISSQIKEDLFIYDLSQAFNLSFERLKKEQEFVKFCKTNHLLYRIDKDYQKSGLGVMLHNDQICFMFRQDDFSRKENVSMKSPAKSMSSPRKPFASPEKSLSQSFIQIDDKPIPKPWTTLPVDESGKIAGWELMAFGWQKHHRAKWSKLEPIKIIAAKDSLYGDKYAIELMTGYPQYSIKNIGAGLGFFGHTYLVAYRPIKDERVAVYSVGYDLKHIISPDFFHFMHRPRIPSVKILDNEIENAKKDMVISKYSDWNSLAIFQRFKWIVEGLKKIENDFEENPQHKLERSDDLATLYLKNKGLTCSNFALSVINETFKPITQINQKPHFDGRFSIFKHCSPPPYLKKMGSFVYQRLPSCLQYVMDKIHLVVNGAFPSSLSEEQINANGGYELGSDFHSLFEINEENNLETEIS